MKVREEKKKLNVAIDQTVMDNFASLKKDDVSYAIGVDMGSKLMRNEIEVNGEILSKGIKDLLTNSALLMTDQEMKEAISIAQKELQAKKQEKTITLAEKNKSEGEAFLAANKNRDGVKTLSSGLQYKIFKNGSGKSPSEKDTVTVNYRGTFIDGTEFDSSYKRGQLATFPLSAVIKGWTEGLQYVKEGGKIQLVIPANLAYGEKGVGNIGPNAVLVFDVELIKINEK